MLFALNVQVIFELAKSFTSKRPGREERGPQLFVFLESSGGEYLFLKHPHRLLQEEALYAIGEREAKPNPWLDGVDRQVCRDKMAQLAKGSFDERDSSWTAVIQREPEMLRSEGRRFNQIASADDRQHSTLPFGEYINAVWPNSSRPVLIQKLRDAFPRADDAELPPVADKLLSDPSYRTAHAMVRGDFYVRWRALNGSVSKDVHGDCLNAVHSAYCDNYVTADDRQERWVPHVLGANTRFRLLPRPESELALVLTEWLADLRGIASP